MNPQSSVTKNLALQPEIFVSAAESDEESQKYEMNSLESILCRA
jgi:hypothetical protein